MSELILVYLLLGALVLAAASIQGALGGLPIREKAMGIGFYVLLWPLCLLWALLSVAAALEDWIGQRL